MKVASVLIPGAALDPHCSRFTLCSTSQSAFQCWISVDMATTTYTTSPRSNPTAFLCSVHNQSMCNMHTSPPSSSYRPILGHQQTNLNAHKLFRTLQSKQLLRPSFKGDLPPSSTHLLTSGNRDSVADPSSVFASNSRNSPLEQIISHSLNFPCQDWFNRMLRTDG